MKKKLVVFAVILAAAGIAFFAFRGKKEAASGPTYEETPVTRGDIQVKILSTGVVQPENRLEIKPPIPGRVEKVLVDEGDRVAKGRMLVLMSSSERAALLDAARAKGADELKRWEEFYQAAPILAPIDGTVILRNVEPGQTVTSSDALLVMSDRLTVKAQVDETDIAEIKVKQEAEIRLDAYPDQAIPARVDQIAYDAKTVNNVTTYVVDVLPDETPAFMRSGMTANVTFMAAAKANVLRVPTNAVTDRDGRPTVRVAPATKGEEAKESEIQTGVTDGKFTEVTSGLAETDVILVPQLKPSDPNSKAAATNPFSPFSGRRPR